MFFCLLLFERTFASFLKEKKSKTRIFVLFFLMKKDDRRIRIREAQKHVDPVDPNSDPEHCLKEF